MSIIRMIDHLPEELKTKYFDFQQIPHPNDAFCKDLLEQLKISYDSCKYYRDHVCQQFDFTIPEQLTMDNLETIPYVPTNIYKESDDRFLEIMKVPFEDIALFSSSSSTTGDPSIVPRTLADFDQIQYNSIKCYSEFFRWKELTQNKDTLTFNFAPSRHFMTVMAKNGLNNKEHKKKFGKYTRYFTACMNKPWDYVGYQEYMVRAKLLKCLWAVITSFSVRGGIVLTVSKMLKMINKVLETGYWKKLKVNKIMLGGSALIMNNMFIKRLIPDNTLIDLDGRAMLISGGGGWDGVKGQAKMDAVVKSEFVERVEKVFNIKPKDVGDIYGFTESPNLFGGHWSEKYQDFLLHCPDTARVIVRSLEALDPVKEGEQGLLEVISPYGVNGTINQAVLVDDIVELISKSKCPECGYEGATFRVIGRLKNAQGKSCSSLINWVY